MERYDSIGKTYASTRRADPRIAALIDAGLDDARSVVNVGAGTGSYEPSDREVLAVEPSAVMRAQRPPGAAPCLDARGEALPLADDSFDAALATLTIHHWSDWRAGCAELRRVARERVVVWTWGPSFTTDWWLVRDYLPEIARCEGNRFATIAEQAEVLGATSIVEVPIAHDCADGFLGAFWRRPDAYLDPVVRAGISMFSFLDQAVLDGGLRRLADDLASGAWHERHAELLDRDALDLGHRLLIAEL